MRGIRVLDLTRVIAGPVATRTFALLGAEVLRIDPPALQEPEWQHLEAGQGKRSALLDLGSPEGAARFESLLGGADVLALGYRPQALARLGLEPETLAARHPGLVIARLSAWGFSAENADRRGFDSIVQAASGIAWIETRDGERPGALPAQALDHSAGYLLAAEVLALLERQSTEGGSWVAETSLRRVAAELLGRARSAEPEPPASTVLPRLQTFDVGGARLTTVAPAITYPGGPTDYPPPRPWGRDLPQWL
jgi:crotonobetainyl-CoA:carnitine CoA-transferase CaiB-like acyl-CoA transferase